MSMAIHLAIFFTGLACLAVATLTEQHELIKFSYSGATGPNKWGSLSPEFSTCSTGKFQSPVNIVKKDILSNKKLGSLTRDYYPVNSTLINHGFYIGLQFEQSAGKLTANGKNYTLHKLHWHSPSEHTIDGIRYPLELHLVHMANDGNISVVAVLFQYGDTDPLLAMIKDPLDKLAKEVCAGHEEAHIPVGMPKTKQLERKTRKYFRYMGSLTTPPCTENVMWSILGKVRTIKKEQLAALKAPLDWAYRNNSRPTQPLHGRKIELYNDLGEN